MLEIAGLLGAMVGLLQDPIFLLIAAAVAVCGYLARPYYAAVAAGIGVASYVAIGFSWWTQVSGFDAAADNAGWVTFIWILDALAVYCVARLVGSAARRFIAAS